MVGGRVGASARGGWGAGRGVTMYSMFLAAQGAAQGRAGGDPPACFPLLQQPRLCRPSRDRIPRCRA
jgi:hypothetical protein